MATKKVKKREEYYDGWEGLADLINKTSTVKQSQCATCKNKIGTSKCKIFGERPYQYGSTFANVSCPKKEGINNA